jgi:transcriptional regulator
MYLPQHFEETRLEVLQALVASQPLSTLITLSDAGLVADQIPLVLRANEGPLGTLVGHVARANPVWQATRLDLPVLLVFQGPQHYISPGWYPSKQEHGKVVPTWNYVVVQARGLLQIHDDVAWVRAQASQITRQQESGAAKPWAVEDAPRDYTDAMLRAVVGISIAVTQWSGKWKVSQNQPAANRAGVVQALSDLPDSQAADMAVLVRAHAPLPPPQKP